MSETPKQRREREDLEWEKDRAEDAARKAKREAERSHQTLRAVRYSADEDRDNLQWEIDARVEEIHELKIKLAERDAALSSLQPALVTSIGYTAELQRAIQRALSRITHGEASLAAEVLRQAMVRSTESNVPEQLGGDGPSVIPVAGRMLEEGRVSLTPTAQGLVIRVDDDARSEFWLELVLSETKLLRALAQVHRLIHGVAPRPSSAEAGAGGCSPTVKGESA